MKTVILSAAIVLLVGLVPVAEPSEQVREKVLAAVQADKARTQLDLDRLKGMKAAVADIEAGKLKQKSFPLPDPAWHGTYVELLKKECGVDWETIANNGAARQIAEMAGYNDVMRVEIEHRFGRGVLDKLGMKAETQFRKSQGKE